MPEEPTEPLDADIVVAPSKRRRHKDRALARAERRAKIFVENYPGGFRPPQPRKRRLKPNLKQIQQIRWALAMTDMMPFMRCPARSSKKRAYFESLGDTSHSALGHVCEKCRCDSIAGEGTQGDFYGIGENTGHYGVGWCKWHERGWRQHLAIKFARHQMEAMRSIGVGRMTDQNEFMEVASQRGVMAAAVQDVNQGINLVLDHIKSFKELVDNGGLTEKGKDGPVEASDKARIDMACKLATTIASLTKVSVDVNATTMISIDAVVSRIKQELNLIPRFILDEKQRAMFLEEYRRIWASAIGAKP